MPDGSAPAARFFLTDIKAGRAFCVNDVPSVPVGRSEQAEEG
jgi:hypothetical protein